MRVVLPICLVVVFAVVGRVRQTGLGHGARQAHPEGEVIIFQHFVVGDHVGVIATRAAGTWSYHALALPSTP